MEIIEVEKVKPYILNSFPIGMGMSAICFKNKDKKVVKIFKKNDNTSELIKNKSFLEKMIKIGELSNDTYIGPDTILTYEGEVIGYLYPYVDSKLLMDVSDKTKLSELFMHYDKLLSDTKLISDAGLRLEDLHRKNILFNGYYHVIDLDWAYFPTDNEFTYNFNVSDLFQCIMNQIYNTKQDELQKYKDEKIAKYMKCLDRSNLDAINDFIKYFSNICDSDDATIGEVRKNIKVKNIYNSYARKNNV